MDTVLEIILEKPDYKDKLKVIFLMWFDELDSCLNALIDFALEDIVNEIKRRKKGTKKPIADFLLTPLAMKIYDIFLSEINLPDAILCQNLIAFLSKDKETISQLKAVFFGNQNCYQKLTECEVIVKRFILKCQGKYLDGDRRFKFFENIRNDTLPMNEITEIIEYHVGFLND